MAVCPTTSNSLLAIPGIKEGQVNVVDIGPTQRAPAMIAAHKHRLACMALSYNGELLATASEVGTRFCVFTTTQPPQLVAELRRSVMFKASIGSLRFNHNASLLLASSEHTIHVYSLSDPEKNTSSDFFFPFLQSKSDYGVMKFTTQLPSLCVFGGDRRSIVAISPDLTFHEVRMVEGKLLRKTACI